MTINLDSTFREAFEEYLRLPSTPSTMLRERRLDFERLEALCNATFRSVNRKAFVDSIQHTWAEGQNGRPYDGGTCRNMRDRLSEFLQWVNRQLDDPGRYTFPAFSTPPKRDGEDYLDPDSLRTIVTFIAMGGESKDWGWMNPVLRMMLAFGLSPEEIAAVKSDDCDVEANTIQLPSGETKGGAGANLVLGAVKDVLRSRTFAFHDKETAAQGAQKIRDTLKKLHNKRRFKGEAAVALKDKLKYFPRRMAKTVAMAKEDPESLIRALEGVQATGGKVEIKPEHLERLEELKKETGMEEQSDQGPNE